MIYKFYIYSIKNAITYTKIRCNKQYNSSNLSIHIMRIFSKIYDISISAVELRHYYSTYINYLVKQKELTEKEHRKICDMMNHSYEENKKYAYCL